MNAYEDPSNTLNQQKIPQTSRVDQVIYPSSIDAMATSENGPMISLAIKIHVDPRQDVKVHLYSYYNLFH